MRNEWTCQATLREKIQKTENRKRKGSVRRPVRTQRGKDRKLSSTFKFNGWLAGWLADVVEEYDSGDRHGGFTEAKAKGWGIGALRL